MPPPVPAMLPYFRPPSELPGPLPTAEEIRNAPKSELAPRRCVWGKDGGVCVIRGIYVVKSDISVTENEGNALLFLEQHAEIPAPRLHAMYRRPAPSGPLHLVMDYLPGADLESLWAALPAGAKSSVAAQLRSVFARLRSLEPPRAFLGGVCGGRLPDPLFGTARPDAGINGPFRSEAEVGLALARASRCLHRENGRPGWMSDFFSRHLPPALGGRGTRFTHGDLHMRNILVEKVPADAVPGGDAVALEADETGRRWGYRVSGIVDWELAGWYPAYWEYATAFARYQWDSDWLEKVDAIIRPYPLEAAMFLLVLRDLQFV